MARIRGLELLYNLVKDKIKSKQDCVVAALHCLLTNESLQCVGTGETFSEDDAHSTTELLPQGWNNNQEVYTLRYTSKNAKDRYLVKIVKAGSIMHINIVLNEDKTAAMSANIEKYVSDSFSDYSSAYKELDSLKDTFQKELVEKIIAPPSTSTAKPSDNKRSLKVGSSSPSNPRPPMSLPPDYSIDDSSPFSGGQPFFPQVGGRDLDPLGRGQGGMLLDPLSFGPRGGGVHMPPMGGPHGLPRGSVPPGARFDPFGPPMRGPNRGHPDPDHFRPPDYDEFM